MGRILDGGTATPVEAPTVVSVAGKTGDVTLTTSDVAGLPAALNGKANVGAVVTSVNGQTGDVTVTGGGTGAVTSVAGRTGDVVLGQSDVTGLVSALKAKVTKVNGVAPDTTGAVSLTAAAIPAAPTQTLALNSTFKTLLVSPGTWQYTGTEFTVMFPDLATDAPQADAWLTLTLQDFAPGSPGLFKLQQSLRYRSGLTPFPNSSTAGVYRFHVRWISALYGWEVLSWDGPLDLLYLPWPTTYTGGKTAPVVGSSMRSPSRSSVMQTLQDYYQIAPQDVLAWLAADGTTIRTALYNLGDLEPGKLPLTTFLAGGYYLSGDKGIRILEGNGKHTFLHEMCHAVDFQYVRKDHPNGWVVNGQTVGQFSNHPDFVQAWTTVRNAWASRFPTNTEYANTNVLEGWAETLSWYWNNDLDLLDRWCSAGSTTGVTRDTFYNFFTANGLLKV